MQPTRTATSRRAPRSRLTAGLAGVVVLGLLVGPGAALVAAAPAGAAIHADASTTSWGYGGSRWVNVSGSSNGLNGSASYSIHAFFGVQVALTEVNTSATTFELTANRTMVGDVFASYCRPSCSSPTAAANLTLRAWEVAHASANFTTTGQVNGAHGPVPAVAIVDSSVSARANLTETETIQLFGPAASHTASWDLSVHSDTFAALSFAPALGLVPDNLSATPNWTASSQFHGSGSWQVGFDYRHTPLSGPPVGANRSSSGTVSGTGNVSLQGMVVGPLALRGGISTDAVRIFVSGPFAVREGFILVPTGADLFGASGDWKGEAVGDSTAGTDAIDYAPSPGERPTLEASATTYAATSSAAQLSAPAGVTTMASPAADGTGPQTVQAQPESASQANGAAGCLLSGSCPPGAPAHRGLAGGLIVLAVAVVGLTVVVVGLVVARQPPRKEPVSPNASLYPPGAVGTSPPPGRPPAPASPPPPEDPLDHLW